MKKLLALLLACSAMSLAMVGCGDKKSDDDEKESSSSSSSISESSDDESSAGESSGDESSDEESSDDESSDDGSSVTASAVAPGQIDPAVVGEWYNDEMGGTFCFDEENQVAMGMDYSSIMYFNADKELVMLGGIGSDGITVPVDYDGSNLSVSYSDETTDTNVELMTLVRVDDADPDSLDGVYELMGGDLYDALIANLYGDIDSTVSMTVSGETLSLKMSVCEYSADGENMEMFGDGLSLFGIENQEDAVMSYTISGDTLSIVDAAGEKMDFTKIS